MDGVGIVLAGGPAPGINGVISAATIEAINRGKRVFGIHRGFERLMKGDGSAIREISLRDVSRIHSDGGSLLETSRANPRATRERLKYVVEQLHLAGIRYLVTIGGDGTAATAEALSHFDSLQVAHVPKTIDNDLPLPEKHSTFGYQSAREVGPEIAERLMLDAQTTERFYMIVAQGRKAGHLALGIGIASGATATVIPEEFTGTASLALLRDIIAGTMIKRAVMGRPYGVIVLAEGLAEKIPQSELPALETAERDGHGFIRYAEFDIGGHLRLAVRERLAEFGLGNLLVIDKNVGYELRSGPPNPFDREYTRFLGYGAIDYLLQGGNGAMITRQRDNIVPVMLSELIDRETGMIRVRFVDTHADLYRAAKKYMIRLTRADLKNSEFMAGVERITQQSAENFRQAFSHVAEHDAGFPEAYPIYG